MMDHSKQIKSKVLLETSLKCFLEKSHYIYAKIILSRTVHNSKSTFAVDHRYGISSSILLQHNASLASPRQPIISGEN